MKFELSKTVLGILMVLSAVGCMRTRPSVKEAVSSTKSVETQKNSEEKKQEKTVEKSLEDQGCLTEPKFQVPIYLAGKSVVLTRFLKTCATKSGVQGIERDSPWLAMGFPCSGGGGRIDLKGHAHAPKMVSFILSTDCPMSASSKEVIKRQFVDALGLSNETKLMAINPFALHFWEIPGMPDSDTGFAIELRSAPALEGGWKRIRDKEKLRIRLYGRENAWVRGDHFYVVEADLYLSSSTQFAIEIVNVKPLTSQEIEAVKTRCLSLKTARHCSEIF